MAQLNLTETSNSLKTWLGHGTPMRCGLHLSTTSSGGFSGTMENDEFVSVMQTFTANPQKQVSQSRSSSDHNSSTLTLDMLPSEILFQIFRHLSASAILRIGRCNRRLAAVSSSDRLWKLILEEEMAIWPIVSSTSLPNHHDLCYNVKQTYLRCSPLLARRSLPSRSKINKASSPPARGLRMRFFQRSLRIAILGPGLEASARGLVGNMLWSDASPFQVTGLSAGRQGVGGAVSLQHEGGDHVDLITLYQHTAFERRNPEAAGVGRLTHGGSQLSEATQALLGSIHAFVYVVDAEKVMQEQGRLKMMSPIANTEHEALGELKQVLSPQWSQRYAPLLVLSAHTSDTPHASRASAVEVAKYLQLPAQGRKWRIENYASEIGVGSLQRGVQWLLSSCA